MDRHRIDVMLSSVIMSRTSASYRLSVSVDLSKTIPDFGYPICKPDAASVP
jgi:hypothetical protein